MGQAHKTYLRKYKQMDWSDSTPKSLDGFESSKHLLLDNFLLAVLKSPMMHVIDTDSFKYDFEAFLS